MTSYCILRSKGFLLKSVKCQTLFGQQAVRAMAAKVTQSTRKRRFRLPTTKEAEKLVTTVSGSNLLKEGGEDIKIKDDSEYPDWIWSLRLGKPPSSNEMEYGTKEYWETLHEESKKRQKKFMMVKIKETMRVGTNETKKMEWQERIKYRALASYNFSAGWTTEDLENKPDKKLWLKPQPDEEEIRADEWAKENPLKCTFNQVNRRIGGLKVHSYVNKIMHKPEDW